MDPANQQIGKIVVKSLTTCGAHITQPCSFRFFFGVGGMILLFIHPKRRFKTF
jgi:hypothetical protein